MKFALFFLTLFALCLPQTEAFARGSGATVRSQPQLSTSSTTLYAAAKKKTAKKKKAAAAKKKAASSLDLETLRKPELVSQVAERLDVTKVEADTVISTVFETLADNIVDKKKVALPGFGTFQLRQRAARKGRNPQTGEELDIPASLAPTFTAAKALKERANE